MRRIRILLAVLALALGIGASVARSGVVSAALLKPVADTSERQQVAPGIGANTEDPKKVLRAADKALCAVRSVTYEAQYQGVGAFATRTATVIGKASLAKLPAGDPLVARLAAEGAFYQTGSDEAVAFHTAFDGRMIRKLRTQTKVMVEKDVETDPKGRTLGGVTMLFGGGAYQVMMFEYVWDKPLAKQIDAPVAEYEGRTNIGGVLCHVVYVEYDQRPDGRVKRERWFIGIKDNLPRKFEYVAVDDQGRYGAYVLALSNVRVNPPLDDLAFTIKLPEGYKVKPYEPPNRPALLAVGDSAPNWKLADAEGKMHGLADYRGKLLVLDFWATWCGPCVQAMPSLQKLHEKYHQRGVDIIGINAWEESNAAAYMKKKGYTYGLLLKGETIAEVYRANVLPTIYIIGIDGKIIYRSVGADAEILAAIIEQKLKEQGR
jgi:thiol-disulfide isomerase/thioredoxin